MRFSDTSTPAQRIPEVSGPALPVVRAARVRRRSCSRRRGGRRRRRGRWYWRRCGGRVGGGRVGRVAVAGDQCLDHLNDLVAVGRVQQQRGRRRRRIRDAGRRGGRVGRGRRRRLRGGHHTRRRR